MEKTLKKVLIELELNTDMKRLKPGYELKQEAHKMLFNIYNNAIIYIA